MEIIPSKDVRQYLTEIHHEFTDFEKAVIIYASENSIDDMHEKLRELKDTTDDMALIQQIEESVQYDEAEYKAVCSNTVNAVYLFEVYDQRSKLYQRENIFQSVEAAKIFADRLKEKYRISKVQVFDNKDMQADADLLCDELGYLNFDASGKLCAFWSGEKRNL